MKRLKILITLLTLAVSGGGVFASAASEHLAALPSGVELGFFDESGRFANVPTMAYEHVWYLWNEPTNLLAQLEVIAARGRTTLLTVEPFPIKGIGSTKTLLPDITSGKYDSVIKTIAEEVRSFNAPVVIRFAPEMDHESPQPWSKKAPASYIAAYRHFATLFHRIAPNSSQCWSPVGDEGLEAYYPGGDVVDYTGFSIYEIPAVSTSWVGHPQSFADWMNDKYPHLAHFGKPIILAEVAVVSTTNQKDWMRAAFKSVGRYPLVNILVYYNAVDPVSWARWGGPAKPSWVIDPDVFRN
jgi:endoglucanase